MNNFKNSRYAELKLYQDNKLIKGATLDINDKWSFDLQMTMGSTIECDLKIYGWHYNRMWDILTHSIQFVNPALVANNKNQHEYSIEIKAGYTDNMSRGISFIGTVFNSEIFYGDNPEDTYIKIHLVSWATGEKNKKSLSFEYNEKDGNLYNCLIKLADLFGFDKDISETAKEYKLESFAESGNITTIIQSLKWIYPNNSYVIYCSYGKLYFKNISKDGDFVYNKKKKVHTIMGTTGMIGTPSFDSLFLKVSNRLRYFGYGEKYPVISYFVPFLYPKNKNGSDIRVFSVATARYIGDTRGTNWKVDLEMLSSDTVLTLNKLNSIIKGEQTL